MYEVGIVFKNGSKAQFYAQEFDMGLAGEDVRGAGKVYDEVHKFTYKDTNGEDAPIYLNPNEVAGIAVAYVQQYSEKLWVD